MKKHMIYLIYYDRRSTMNVVNKMIRKRNVISSDVIRGYNDTIILYLLLEHDSYGYEISKNIREISEGKYVMKETTLYSAFTRLEKNGFIVSYHGNETLGRRRTYYQITPAGRMYYKEKCAEWSLTQEVISKFIKRSGENGSHQNLS